jgi:DNA polymerase III epsilon subunit-like protein
MKELIFLDTETTGNEIGKDRLCQVCFKVGDKITTEYFKPPLPMSVKSMSITHITNEMLEDKKPFSESEMLGELRSLLSENILVAHNAKFDIAMLEAEGISVLQSICTLRVARFMDKDNSIPEYNLQYLRYHLGLKIEGTAHDAEGDVKVLHALFQRLMIKMITEEGTEAKAVEKMIDISSKPTLFTKFNFGKHKDKLIEEVLRVDRGYLEWLLKTKLENADNEEDWIYTLQYHLNK